MLRQFREATKEMPLDTTFAIKTERVFGYVSKLARILEKLNKVVPL